MHGEIIDRFMRNRSFAFPLANIWCLREHSKNGFGVGGRKFFTLVLIVSHLPLYMDGQLKVDERITVQKEHSKIFLTMWES